MSRDRLTFRQRDITAAIKAVKAAGEEVARIEVTHDGFKVYPGKPDDGTPASDLDADRAFREQMRKFDEQREQKKSKRKI